MNTNTGTQTTGLTVPTNSAIKQHAQIKAKEDAELSPSANPVTHVRLNKPLLDRRVNDLAKIYLKKCVDDGLLLSDYNRLSDLYKDTYLEEIQRILADKYGKAIEWPDDATFRT